MGGGEEGCLVCGIMSCAAFVGAALPVKGSHGFAAQAGTRTDAHKVAVAAPLARRVQRAAGAAHAPLQMAITRPERYSTTDWINSLVTLPKSRILRRISSHIVANVAVSGLIVALFQQYPDALLWRVTPLPHTVLGTVMGLMLVFRTNSAYDRFWEGRKIWGGIVNRTRSLAVNFLNFVGPTSDAAVPALSARLIKLDQAFPLSLADHLRGEPTPAASIKALIPEEHWEEYLTARNRPLLTCKLMSRYVAQAYSMRDLRDGNTNAERETIERGINDLIDYMGMCERIVKTPVPLSYSRHTSRFLSLWCLTLPVIFVKADDWLVLPIMFFVSFSLFSIEEIGHLIEDPFIKHPDAPGIDLPLEAMASTINGDLQDMLDSFPSWANDLKPEVRGAMGRQLEAAGKQ
ncbi:UPF0187 protein [Porphyridium purpureum]|uniref:UPF0187 protein n=1 Tax=Porphyridium purpureum TaxID=35688 RepID=A0A5J4YR08_PORPP|nr:UPF0187 protein [Porphyridium purpureum]|eukprot:POR6454..scf236_6